MLEDMLADDAAEFSVLKRQAGDAADMVDDILGVDVGGDYLEFLGEQLAVEAVSAGTDLKDGACERFLNETIVNKRPYRLLDVHVLISYSARYNCYCYMILIMRALYTTFFNAYLNHFFNRTCNCELLHE